MHKSECVKYIGKITIIVSILLFRIALFPIKIEFQKYTSEEYAPPKETEQYFVEILTFEDLYDFIQLFHEREQTYYVVSLKNNIIIPNGRCNLSIGSSDKPFWGQFLGNNYKISGINIYNTNDVTGFFNCITSAYIENLHIEGIIRSTKSIGTGGIVGSAINSKINFCSFCGTINAEGGSVGGIVGNNHSIISNCQSKAVISGIEHGGYGDKNSDFSGRFGTGGIAGNNEKIITYSDNTGEVNNDTGGIVGWNNGIVSYCSNISNGNGSGIADVNTGTISCCTNIGSMSGNAVAGIALTCTEQGYIEKCINLGTMNGRYVGGLVTFLGQDGDTGEGNIEDSISVVNRSMKAINYIKAGKAKVIHTISSRLAENAKQEIDMSIKTGNKIDIAELYISLLECKKKKLVLQSMFLFLLGILLWKLQYLKNLYKKSICQSREYKQIYNSIRKNMKSKKEIQFGHLKFDKQTLPLNWKILYQGKERLLLISNENICCRVYHEKYQPVNWYESSLFKWLNSEFREMYFTETEKSFLDGDITILDRASVKKYFPLKEMRKSKNSQYANQQGAVSKDAYGCWWIKSYDKTDHPPFVTADGKLSSQGIKNNFDGICVKPIICIYLRGQR